MSLALVLIIVGLLIIFGAFVFAAINMLRVVTSRTSSGLGGMFVGHIGAMVGMAFGGLLFVTGLILAGVDLMSRLAR